MTQQLSEAQILDLRQCGAETRRGVRCTRSSTHGRRCKQHREPIRAMESCVDRHGKGHACPLCVRPQGRPPGEETEAIKIDIERTA